MNCLFNDVTTCSGDTSEHVVQECLGGTLERPDIICKTCNHYFGERIDPGLGAYYSPLIDVLRPLMPMRFHDCKRHATTVEKNVPLVLSGGGGFGLRKIHKEYKADGSLKALYAPGNSDRAQLQYIISKLAPGRSYEFSIGPISELMENTMANFHSSYHPSEHRAAVKTVLEVIDWQTNSLKLAHYARTQQLRAVRNYVRNAVYEEHIDIMSLPMYNLEDEFDRVFTNTEDNFSNRTIFCNNASNKICYGFLQVANTMPVGICLGSSVEDRDFSLIYESSLLRDGADRSERVDGSIITFREFKDAEFTSRTPESALFAFSKMYQAVERQHGRATVLIDMRDDTNVGEGLTSFAIDAVFNRGESGASLLRAVCEPILRLRFPRDRISVKDWIDLFSIPNPASFNPTELETSIRTSKSMGSQRETVLRYFRDRLQILVEQHGYPRMFTLFKEGLGVRPGA